MFAFCCPSFAFPEAHGHWPGNLVDSLGQWYNFRCIPPVPSGSTRATSTCGHTPRKVPDMTKAAQQTIQEFMDSLAAKTSTPGGGGAAALTGAEAAALISMVVNFTVGRKKYADVEEEMQGYLARSEALRQELLDLIDADAEAFNAVSACYGMPKETEEQKAARTAAMQKALKGAAQVPYQVAERCLAILRMAEPVGAKGNPNVVSDAATAAYLGQAALLSAIANVSINLKYIKDEAFVQEWAAKRDDLVAQAKEAYAAALAACEQTLGVPL